METIKNILPAPSESPTGDMTVAEIAEQILTVMPEERWLKGIYGESTGSGWNVCLLGAYSLVMFGWPFYDVLSETERNHPFISKLAGVIQEQFPEIPLQGTNEVCLFNDSLNTTYDDMRLVLEKIRAGS